MGPNFLSRREPRSSQQFRDRGLQEGEYAQRSNSLVVCRGGLVASRGDGVRSLYPDPIAGSCMRQRENSSGTCPPTCAAWCLPGITRSMAS